MSLVLDGCGRGWSDGRTSDAHCAARSRWAEPPPRPWMLRYPLQVGSHVLHVGVSVLLVRSLVLQEGVYMLQVEVFML